MPRLFQIHGAGFDLPGEIVFDQILLFEIAIVQTDSRRAALRPDVVEGIGSAELEGNEMIEFAGLVIAGIVRRGGDAVPAISYLLLAVGGYAVADTAGTESRAAKDVESDGGISAPGVQPGSGRRNPLERPVLQPFGCWPLGTPKADEALLLIETGQYLQVATVAA